MPRLPRPALGLLILSLALALPSRPSFAADEPAKGEHAAAASSEGHGGDPNILEPQIPLAIWTVVVFVLLLLVLRALAWKPLLDALHRREEYMEKTLEDAERARHEAERLLAEHRKQMEEASAQVRSLLEKAHRDAEATANDIVSRAQAEAEAGRHRAERDIATARDQALMEIWDKTADLAVTVAGKVLGRDLNEGDHRRLIDVATHELPERPVSANGHGGQA